MFDAFSFRMVLATLVGWLDQPQQDAAAYLAYYHQSRTHLSLAKDSPQPRPIARPTIGPVIAIPQVGGLLRRYDRRAA